MKSTCSRQNSKRL